MDYSFLFDQIGLVLGAIYSFMGVHFLVSKVPRTTAFQSYKLSRRLMGAAFLSIGLTLYIKIYLFSLPIDGITRISFDLVRIFLAVIFFAQASFNFFDRSYLTRRRLFIDSSSLVFIVLLFLGILLVNNLVVRQFFLLLSTFWLVAYLTVEIVYYVRLRSLMQQRLKAYYSVELDNFFKSTFRCMSLLMLYGAFGVPYVYATKFWQIVYILCGVLVYSFVFYNINFSMVYYEAVERAYQEIAKHEQKKLKTITRQVQAVTAKVSQVRVQQWVERREYAKPGVTLESMAAFVGTNRNYLSAYINDVYHLSFSDWVSALRIALAKELMLVHPEYKTEMVAITVGFSSSSYFSKVFRKCEGTSPLRWREEALQAQS